VLAGLERKEFFVPGSILRLELQRGHWLTAGLPVRSIAWFEEGPAFQPTADAEGRVEIVGRFGTESPLLSGWISGAEHIEGRGAIAVVRYGRGEVILFAFRPQYRGQTIATYPLIFNALEHGLARRDRLPGRGEED
jgi:DNA-binding transcriptional regulator YdaS (Cro superfamily)